MKKISLFVILTMAVVTGCNSQQSIEEASNPNVRFAGMIGSIRIVTDNETGCKYIREEVGASSTTRSIALSPLMKSDGTVDCD